MLSLLWVVFFCLLLAILKLSLLLPQWDIFLIFCFTSTIPLVRCFLFSIFTATTPFHSEIDKLVKSEKLIGFKAVRYSILKELHFRLCLTSLRLSLNICKKNVFASAKEDIESVSEAFELATLRAVTNYQPQGISKSFFQRGRWWNISPKFFSSMCLHSNLISIL